MKQNHALASAGFLAFLMMPSATCFGAVLTVPPGLQPGDHYRIVFVTSGTRFATSSQIADYDDFVDENANNAFSLLAPLGATWKVIGSTATESAFDHIGGAFSVPLYRLDGVLVATGSADLWDGSLVNPINIDDKGFVSNIVLWTGTLADGSPSPLEYLGSQASPDVKTGFTSDTNSQWIDASHRAADTVRPFYGISSELTVGRTVVPEPGIVSMLLMGAMLMIGAMGYRRLTLGRD